MLTIIKYEDKMKEEWDEFNRKSKNFLFMFCRDYMDYHRDRFEDYSLMIYAEDQLIALLPACKVGNQLISHGGLTYGGIISNAKMKQHTMLECFDLIIQYCREMGIYSLLYKCIPHIYHKQAAEEDRYALFVNHAELSTIDASTYLNLQNPLKMSKGRKAQISRARREGVNIKVLDDDKSYFEFIQLENRVLQEKYNTQAVHSAKELKLLHDYFANNIHLYAAVVDEKIIAGSIIYEYDTVVHTQYLAANDEARQIGALDLIISTIIERYRDEKMWLDFGISTEHGRIFLNEGLIAQKEGFGGRTGVYESWIIKI